MPETPIDIPEKLYVDDRASFVIALLAVYGATSAALDVTRIVRRRLIHRKIRQAKADAQIS